MNAAESAKISAWWEKHLPVVKAHAQGQKIQAKNPCSDWLDCACPDWHQDHEYRIKPSPRTIKTIEVFANGQWAMYWDSASKANAHLSFEETLKWAKKHYTAHRVSSYVEIV